MGATFNRPRRGALLRRQHPRRARLRRHALGSTCCSGLKLKVEASRDIGRDLWTKLLVNAVINPLSVILQGHNRLVAEERFDALKSPILAEGAAVAAAEGFELHIDAAFVNRFVSSDNITSMLQDFRRNKPTEIDFINGAIAAAGQKARHRHAGQRVRGRPDQGDGGAAGRTKIIVLK